jgi:hypothetical protein
MNGSAGSFALALNAISSVLYVPVGLAASVMAYTRLFGRPRTSLRADHAAAFWVIMMREVARRVLRARAAALLQWPQELHEAAT